METTTTPRTATSIHSDEAFKHASRLGWIAGIANDKGATAGRRRIAREAFARSISNLVKYEDSHGIAAASWISELLTASRQKAQAAGLLTPGDVCRIEGEAVAHA